MKREMKNGQVSYGQVEPTSLKKEREKREITRDMCPELSEKKEEEKIKPKFFQKFPSSKKRDVFLQGAK
jgi:hypothetical protein